MGRVGLFHFLVAGPTSGIWVTGAGRRNRLVHDAADGARAAAALDAAAEATIDLAGGARRLFGTDRGAHVVVSQHVARTDNHGRPGRQKQNVDFVAIPFNVLPQARVYISCDIGLGAPRHSPS